MKTCTKCGECKPLDTFSRQAKNKDGLSYYCKPCAYGCRKASAAKNAEHYREVARAYAKQRRATDPLKRERKQIWRNKNPEKQREMNARASAAATPAYIAQRLRLPVATLTPDLLALKREQILNHRALKQLEQTLKEANEK